MSRSPLPFSEADLSDLLVIFPTCCSPRPLQHVAGVTGRLRLPPASQRRRQKHVAVVVAVLLELRGVVVIVHVVVQDDDAVVVVVEVLVCAANIARGVARSVGVEVRIQERICMLAVVRDVMEWHTGAGVVAVGAGE